MRLLLGEIGMPDDANPAVENLLPATIGAVAARTARSSTFVELVYRECEINALWSLADIGLRAAGRLSRRRPGDDPADPAGRLVELRLLFEEAYRDLVRQHTAEASATLVRAASLSRWEG